MTDTFETFRDCRTTIPLSFLKVSNLYTIPCGFYGSPNEQNRMCELCTFSQIRSHIKQFKISFGYKNERQIKGNNPKLMELNVWYIET